MEFFAVIGVFATLYFLYRRLKIWAEKNAPPEKADVFELDTSVDNLHKPVFELLPVTENSDAIEFNLLLEKISSYTRLYFYLRDVYGKTVPATVFEKEENLKFKVYETELIRREIDRDLFGKKSSSLLDQESFTDQELKQLLAATQALKRYSSAVAKIYNATRKACFSSANLSKTAKADRLYRINDAEEFFFATDPRILDSLRKSIDAAMKNIFKDPS